MLTIADILGHKTLEMVKRYAHLSDKHKAEAVGKLNQAIFASESWIFPKEF